MQTISVEPPAPWSLLGDPLKGHDYSVLALAASPDGTQFASGDSSGVVHRWNPRTGERLAGSFVLPDEEVDRLAYADEGRVLVVGGRNGSLQWHDARTGNRLETRLQGTGDKITGLAASADGRLLVAATFDNLLQFWDAKTRRPLGTPLRQEGGVIRCAAFNPDSRSVVTASEDGRLRQWDAATLSFDCSYEGYHEPLYPGGERGDNFTAVAFSPDGKRLATGASSRKVRIWDTATRTQTFSFTAGAEVQELLFSPSGRALLVGSTEGVALWGTEEGAGHTGEALAGIGVGNALAYDYDGDVLLAAGDKLQRWHGEGIIRSKTEPVDIDF